LSYYLCPIFKNGTQIFADAADFGGFLARLTAKIRSVGVYPRPISYKNPFKNGTWIFADAADFGGFLAHLRAKIRSVGVYPRPIS